MIRRILLIYVLLLFSSCDIIDKIIGDDDKDDGPNDITTSSSTTSGDTSADADVDQPNDSDNGDGAGLVAPGNFSDAVRGDSLTVSPTFDWDPVTGAVSYEVAIGTSAGGSDALGWTDIGSATSYSATGLTLQNGEMYYTSVRAVDSNGNHGPISQGDGWQNLICPTGYIKVPGNETAGLGGPVYLEGTKSNYDWHSDPTVAVARKISDFCVMKYEAKDAGGHRAESIAAGSPWASIKRQEAAANDDAQEACENNGSGYPEYQLIGNHHWQAIARNIESVSSNFDTSGAAADHAFNRGYADQMFGPGAPADPDDNNGCAKVSSNGLTEPSTADDDCGGGWHINKRTHTLSNGEVIWDFSGNSYEWVRDNSNISQGSNAYVQTVPYTDALRWGPANSYAAQTGSAKAGLGHLSLNYTTGAIVRSGNWEDGPFAGLFSAHLGNTQTYSHISVGFRCVFTP